ncbi:hypothetical protein NXC24_PC00415 (plasmid) [Rhizobium sp. NXC24]|nr:hypothetical protein NXC24_PC00415 [Rhizobium sp. NXC24]
MVGSPRSPVTGGLSSRRRAAAYSFLCLSANDHVAVAADIALTQQAFDDEGRSSARRPLE